MNIFLNHKPTKKQMLVRTAAAVLAGIIVFILTFFDLFSYINNLAGDAIYQHPTGDRLGITIVAIDEKTMEAMGQQTQWSRQVYADLINTLATEEYSPSVIAFDILFTGYKDEEGDKAFAEAAAKAGNVIVGMNVEYSDVMEEKDGRKYINSNHIERIIYPYDELMAVAEVAFTDNKIGGTSGKRTSSEDDYIRYFISNIDLGDSEAECLALASLRRYAEYSGACVPELSGDGQTLHRFSFVGKPGTIEHVSFVDVLDGTVPAASLQGNIIMVGAYANGLQDAFYVPTSHGTRMNGVEIHANIAEAIMSGRLQTDADSTLTALIYGAVTALIVFMLSLMQLPAGAVAAILTLGGHYLICRLLYSSGIYTSFLYLPVAIALAYIGIIVLQYSVARTEKARINKAFKKYVAPQIVEEVARSGNYELQLGGRNKDIAVLFVDIRSFTTMSETLPPEEVVDILNEYFTTITDAVFKNGGTLDKFNGDAAMAVFNSPFDLDDYVYRAVKTALDIVHESDNLKARLYERFGRTVSYGIGVNCGEAVIGNIGSAVRMEYTAIGDTVNTAARLESNAKAGQILISEEVRNRLKDRIMVEDVGEIPLKGKNKSIFVYNVNGIK